MAVEQPPVEDPRTVVRGFSSREREDSHSSEYSSRVGTRSGWRVGGCQVDLAMSARTVARNVSASPLVENVTGAL